jgi:alpha-1,2-mannosyltransferase
LCRRGSQFYISPKVAFYLCLLSNTLAASLAPIQDCDEVFNYWEPTHYLDHGYGLQTWEYSPEYSIRSWLYIVFHAIIGKAFAIVSRTKTTEFYFIRMALAFICAACETKLFSAISRTLNQGIGVLFLMIMVFSPGMFHASAALLPSSFAMYASMLGLSAFMDWRGGLKTARGIMWFGIGALVGWPFAGILAVPFLLEEIVIATISGDIPPTVYRFIDGVARCLLVLVGNTLRMIAGKLTFFRALKSPLIVFSTGNLLWYPGTL